jgi:carbonic anhydrase
MRRQIAIAIGFALATASAFSIARTETHAPHHWSYSGKEGPSHWATLDAEYRLCGSGKAQSPVNIRTNGLFTAELPPLEFDYKASPLNIVDNGHTIQVSYAPGSTLLVGGKRCATLFGGGALDGPENAGGALESPTRDLCRSLSKRCAAHSAA